MWFTQNFLQSLFNKTQEITNTLDNANDISIKPAFIYIYAIFESTITEILRYYLNAFPEKINKDIKVNKEELLKTAITHKIIVSHINSYIRSYSSKSLYEYLQFVTDTLSLNIKYEKEDVYAMSTIRNTIIHDAAKSELEYSHIHNISLASELTMNDLKIYTNFITDILRNFSREIEIQYASYTKEYLLRSLWSYVFSSPLLHFDKIWTFDRDGCLKIQNPEKIKEGISNICRSEYLFLAVFLQQYNNDLNDYVHSFKNIPPLVVLDTENKEKLVEIINFFEYYPLFFNGENIIL